MENTCKNCKHWTRRIEYSYQCIAEGCNIFGEVRCLSGIQPSEDWLQLDPVHRNYGACDLVNTYDTRTNENERMTFIEGDYGDDFYVGENFGCKHFEQK